MKFNKWTVGLAAVGAVSLASVARAEEHAVMTSLANTTLSGYVNTSVQWNWGSPDNVAPVYAFSAGKNDGFNLNVVKLTLEKPLDEGDWAAGYRVDLLFGPDATGYNASANADGTSDFGIKQAYVALRVPVLNGIDLKVGTFDTVIGYEVFDAGSNPNFSRSYGYTVEPTQHTGILASHKWNDYISTSIGVANTLSAGINTRSADPVTGQNNPWRKTIMTSVALTAPDDWGFIGGSTLYAGQVRGFAGGQDDTANYYVGAALKTPITGLTVGLAYDYVNNAVGLLGLPAAFDDSLAVYGAYASYQATEKLSLHGRAEFIDAGHVGGTGETISGMAVTGTLQYDLWANVISRLEARWDRGFGEPEPFAGGDSPDYITLFANIIYKF